MERRTDLPQVFDESIIEQLLEKWNSMDYIDIAYLELGRARVEIKQLIEELNAIKGRYHQQVQKNADMEYEINDLTKAIEAALAYPSKETKKILSASYERHKAYQAELSNGA